MEISTTATFDRLFKGLPGTIKKKAINKTEIFTNNPFHPSLRVEKLHPKKHQVWSFRVDINYRIIFNLLEPISAKTDYNLQKKRVFVEP